MQETTRTAVATMVRRDLARLAVLALLGVLALSALALTPLLASSAAVAHAQEASPPATGDTAPPEPPPDAAAPAAPIRATLFLQVVDPEDTDVEVTLETAAITISGLAAPGAVVSVDGALADVADDGTFSATVELDEGANEIVVVASDGDGNQVEQTLFVARG